MGPMDTETAYRRLVIGEWVNGVLTNRKRENGHQGGGTIICARGHEESNIR